MSLFSSEKKLMTLKSSDGKKFVVEESIAKQSKTIKHMVEEDCVITCSAIPLPNVDSKTLAMMIEYCTKHTDKNVSEEDLNKFDSKFVEKDMPDVFSLLLAANYLNIKNLMDVICQKIADEIKDMMPEEVRKLFNIENDYTLEEEERVRNEHPWAFE